MDDDVAPAVPSDCCEIILPQTPPVVFAETVITGSTPIWLAVTSCNLPKSAFEEVSDPVMNTPNQPRNGDTNGNSTPVAAKALPSVMAIPEKFMM